MQALDERRRVYEVSLAKRADDVLIEVLDEGLFSLLEPNVVLLPSLRRPIHLLVVLRPGKQVFTGSLLPKATYYLILLRAYLPLLLPFSLPNLTTRSRLSLSLGGP
jgi:hypothetical protein